MPHQSSFTCVMDAASALVLDSDFPTSVTASCACSICSFCPSFSGCVTARDSVSSLRPLVLQRRQDIAHAHLLSSISLSPGKVDRFRGHASSLLRAVAFLV